MQNPAEIFRQYRADRCFLELPQYRAERLPDLLRYTPEDTAAGGIVMFANLKPAQAEATIRQQIEHFSRLGLDFEWKVYDFDQPANLHELLVENGFEAGEAEAFMVYQVALWQGAPKADTQAWRIERVTTAGGVADIVAIQQQLYPGRLGWLEQQLLEVLAKRPDTLSLYCAYAGEQPVGSGWTDFPAGSGIAELHGGAVLPAWRGRGVYRSLHAVRMDEIAARGCKLVAVDATAMSRPILQKLGFAFVCNTVPLQYVQQKS